MLSTIFSLIVKMFKIKGQRIILYYNKPHQKISYFLNAALSLCLWYKLFRINALAVHVTPNT